MMMMMMMYFAFFVSDWLWQIYRRRCRRRCRRRRCPLRRCRFFFFSSLCFQSITCFLPLACRSLILTILPCVCLTFAHARAFSMPDVACIFPFLSLSLYLHEERDIYMCKFPRVIVYRRRVNESSHTIFGFLLSPACLPICALNANESREWVFDVRIIFWYTHSIFISSRVLPRSLARSSCVLSWWTQLCACQFRHRQLSVEKVNCGSRMNPECLSPLLLFFSSNGDVIRHLESLLLHRSLPRCLQSLRMSSNLLSTFAASIGSKK